MAKRFFRKLLASALVVFCMLGLQSLFTESTYAKSLNSYTSTSNLVVYKPVDGEKVAIPDDEPLGCTYKYYFGFDYLIQSETPFAAGDSAEITVASGSTYNHITESISDSSTYDIVDEHGDVIATWRQYTPPNASGRIIITITEAGAGKNSISGSILTGQNWKSSNTCYDHDVNQEIRAGWNLGDRAAKRFYQIKAGRLSAIVQSIPSLGIANNSDKTVSYTLYPAGAAIRQLYLGYRTGETLLESAKLKDQFFTVTFPTTVKADPAIQLQARVTYPAEWKADGSKGISANGMNLELPACGSDPAETICVTKIVQQDGESRDDFIARVKAKPLSYGIYSTNMGNDVVERVAYIFLGNSPHDTMTLDDAYTKKLGMTFSDYVMSRPTLSDTTKTSVINLNGNSNVIDGKVSFYSINIVANFDDGVYTNGSTFQTGFRYEYKNGTGTSFADDRDPVVGTVTTGTSGSAVSRGTAALLLMDADNRQTINGVEFKLQRKDGSSWVDVENSTKTTNKGALQVIGLDEGEYRWVQLGYATGYKTSTTYYSNSDCASSHVIESFVLDDEGFTTYVTNQRATYDITFNGGEHAASSTPIVKHVKYLESIQAPSAEEMVGQTGWTFSGWDRNVSPTATGNESYTAQWERETIAIKVKLSWADGLDYDGIRPNLSQLSAKLTLGGHQTQYAASFDSHSEATFSGFGLNKYDDNGVLNDWQVVITGINGLIEGYNFSSERDNSTGNSSENEYVFRVAGTHEPKRQISICKAWDDNDNAEQMRPGQFGFDIYANSGKVSTVNFSSADTCKYSEELPVFENLVDGSAYSYDIRESASAIYDAEIAINQDSAFAYTVTNHLKTPAPFVYNFEIGANVEDEAQDETEPTTVTLSPKSGNEPVPGGADENRNTTVAITEDGADFGDVTFDKAGDYTYTISLNTPDATTGDENGNSEFTVVVRVVRNENNELVPESVRYFDSDGNEVDPSDVFFNVTHLAPEPFTGEAQYKIHTDDPLDEDSLHASIEPVTDGAPMPENNSAFFNPDGSINLGEITFTEPGEYDYKATLDSDIYDLDENEFIVRVVTSLNKDTNQIQVDEVILCDKDGNPIDMDSFKFGIKRKEAEVPQNPNTSDSITQIVVASSALVGLGACLVIARKRR